MECGGVTRGALRILSMDIDQFLSERCLPMTTNLENEYTEVAIHSAS